MDYMEIYQEWMTDSYFDEKTRQELALIKDDETEIKERFYQELKFGTGGLRGIIGAGTNRMNNYTVAKASQGLADYVLETTESSEPSAVVTYDSRIKSDEFALITARVFAANGIKTYLFEGVRPTPFASFAVRHFKADTGVMITASHNPPEYNGYKAYGNDGSQYTTDDASRIIDKAHAVGRYSNVKMMSEDEARGKGLIISGPNEVDEEYIENVLSLALRDDIDKDVCIVYSAMHGVGGKSVMRVLGERGFTNVHPVVEQLEPDGNFPTSRYPNPEAADAFEYSIAKGTEVKADILMATDPDSDRVGVMAKSETGYVQLTGNEVGALLMDYILREKDRRGEIPEKGVLIKTIVSNRFADRIAEKYGLKVIDTLTGFKNIAEAMRDLENEGDYSYVFGYEESIGYLPETFVRDKDAVSTAMLIAEMAGYYKSEGKAVLEKLDEIYQEFGYFAESLYSISMPGEEGREKIAKLMELFRDDYPMRIGELRLTEVMDFKEGKTKKLDGGSIDIELPRENVLKYIFEDRAWYAVRPSGTEPKIKFYVYATDTRKEVAEQRVKDIKDKIDELAKSI
ncbi:phosphoglucomutase [Andreesenia angusta]|uniref:Phosphoglucomutase n=1 Tax=Andreesenia angusta TaxID=39480 RepID=A0A1S1V883_9FIRM|nr:phospho-sugar mutase [Andreesenia angusta]OHW61949.1 phosphoglucomutase [Andreesenia angusta]